VLSTGYGYAVDWWALGVLTYVTITGQQPFTISKDPSQKDDPLKVMRRIVDMSYEVQYPTYATDEACNFISQLLQRNSAKRLGNMQGGVSQIKRHPWFAKFDWALLESGEYTPKPLTLSRQFLEIQRERLIEIERESLLATEMDSARGPTDASMNRANEIFKDF
jgi:serine/threonine protein kinase